MIVAAKINDREKFLAGYGEAAAQLIPKFGGRYLVRAPGAMLLEGAWGDGAGIVISEWPDKEAILTFWNSPEYQEAKKLREGLADVQVLVVEAPKITAE
jgi:uncharacterized protein (DUF1330 family)